MIAFVLGHEGAGIVRAVGSSISGLEPNDPVLVKKNSHNFIPSWVKNIKIQTEDFSYICL
jgi:NADPH:quinone reductase-like Zn-dependent oxidoreductase